MWPFGKAYRTALLTYWRNRLPRGERENVNRPDPAAFLAPVAPYRLIVECPKCGAHGQFTMRYTRRYAGYIEDGLVSDETLLHTCPACGYSVQTACADGPQFPKSTVYDFAGRIVAPVPPERRQ